jgi:hypothetical protein
MTRTAIYDDIERSTGTANPYADDVVGRLHSGYLNGRNPVSLDQWRFTSDDPAVIDRLAELYGGSPQEIEDGKGDPLHELFSEAESIDIIIEDADSVSSEFVLWGKDNKIAMRGDGLTIDNGQNPDPGADLDLPTRKERAKQGLVPSPEVTVYFRLADYPDLGIFKFIKRDAWTFERDLVRDGFYDALDDATGPIKASMTRVPVSFVAKTGARAGKTVSYTTTEMKYKGAAK